MEQKVAVEALRAIPAPSTPTIYSDSDYLIRGAKGFKKKKTHRPNQDLWDELSTLAAERQIT